MAMKNGDARLSLGLLVLRVVPSALLLYGHGWSKLTHYAVRHEKFADPIHLGPSLGFALVVFAEVVCSTLVALGLWTRLAVIPLLIFFAVAAFVQHGADPFPKRELPMIYGIVYLTLALTGPGRYSVDARRGGGR